MSTGEEGLRGDLIETKQKVEKENDHKLKLS